MTRRFCRIPFALLLMLAASTASGQPSAAWPNKPVRLLVPGAAGVAPDIMARLLGEKLSKIWNQPVVVENRPGAGGLIGFQAVKSGGRDDHTFVFAPASAYVLTPYMFKSQAVDIVQDFVPVAMVGISPMMAAVAADSPAKTLADALAMARKDPDKFVISTTAQYTVPNLAVDMISKASGVPLRAIPYTSSGQSISSVLGGDAPMLIDGVPPIDPMIKGKKLKAVAIFSETRLPNRPDLPTAAEIYPSLVINGWFGVVAPRGTSSAAIERVNKDMATVLAMPDIVERFDTLGVYVKTMTPTQFGTYWADERTKWEKVLKDVGAQPVLQ
jgi:tripartite-type tricarboxylate transporter receptor subunit TctC